MTVDIRLAETKDSEGILAIYAPYCHSTSVSFEIAAPSLQQMRERIERISAAYPWIVAEIDGRVAGYVYATQLRERAAYRWAVEVAVYIVTNKQRRGLARALYTTLFSLLRVQGYFKAFASIALPNEASICLHTRLGFEPAGVFRGVGQKAGKWIDVGWWQLELQPEIKDPPDPRTFYALRGSPAIERALTEGRMLANR